MWYKKWRLLVLCCFCGYVASGQPEAWHTFLKRNANPIKIADTSDYSDLKILDKALKNKRIVLLGEFTHGAKEINEVKHRIIRYLHHKLGYRVLLLESGVGELAVMNFERKERSAKSMISAGLVGPWRTAEFLDLMHYIQANQDLIVAGFDPQKSGGSFAAYFAKRFAKIDTALISKITKLELANDSLGNLLRGKENNSSILNSTQSIIKEYQIIIQSIQNNKKNSAQNEINQVELEIIQRTLLNRIAYLNYFAQFKTDNDFRKRWTARDSMMAANIEWYANFLYPNEKIIISAHNFHIANYNEKEAVMGAFLKQIFGTQMFSIGVFAGRGVYANNSRNPEEIKPPTEMNDVRTIINLTNNAASFLNISKQKPGKNTSWIYEAITVDHSFINLNNDNKLVLKKSFDGLLLLREVSMPQYNY